MCSMNLDDISHSSLVVVVLRVVFVWSSDSFNGGSSGSGNCRDDGGRRMKSNRSNLGE